MGPVLWGVTCGLASLVTTLMLLIIKKIDARLTIAESEITVLRTKVEILSARQS